MNSEQDSNFSYKGYEEVIEQEITGIRSLMSKIKSSINLSNELRDLYSMQKLDYLRPELDVATRWNSTYYMLKKVVRMQVALRMLAINHNDIQDLMPTTET
ncbi:3035_t:CDS:2 [Cetraspora pellucida]|uniref:3035_t:CDS:1 n=1 Tax=Cetraspora pellucida TaxID=1433469 RepID=A0ACA9LN24_9GLOM|nr:3035_t:CDS:2 [Cetraspora pellucida]